MMAGHKKPRRGAAATGQAGPARVKPPVAATPAAPPPGALSPDLEAVLRAILAGGAASSPAAAAGDGGGTARPAPSPAAAVKAPVPPAPAQSLWGTHKVGSVLAPFGWMGIADLSAMCARLFFDTPGPGGQAAGVAAIVIVTAAGARTIIRLRGDRKRLKLIASAVRRARKRAIRAWAAAAMWAPVVIWVTPAGKWGMVQLALVAGGPVMAAGHWAELRKPAPRLPAARAAITAGDDAEVAPEAGPEPGPAPVDPRLEMFRARFITGAGASGRAKAALHDAETEGFTDVESGFAFDVVTDPSTDVSFDTVAGQRAVIAALYDVPVEQVLVEPAARRSARRARVTVLTMNGLFANPERWDGVSTYEPATGAFTIGRFGDGSPGRWRLHAPGSGMWGGAVYGAQGTGKSGDLHLVAAQAGIVIRCPACDAYREEDQQCADCQPSRQFIVLVGDPQKRMASAWKGRADLTFWGADACVFQARLAYEIMEERDAAGGTVTWTDAKGRTREGRGWFDPTPDLPGVVSITDELPKVINSANGAEAVVYHEAVNREGRKSGEGQVVAAQLPDADHTGNSRANRVLLAAHNTVAHRLDGTSRAMTAVRGNARDLPDGEDMHGVGFIAGIDDKSATPYRTLEFPEDAADGVDVLDMAELISELPLTLDPAVQRVFDRYHLTRGMVVDDEWVAALRASEALAAEQAKQSGGVYPVTTTAGRQGQQQPAAGPVSAGAVEEVAGALQAHFDDHRGPAEPYDLMEATGLSQGPVTRALAALAATGRARHAGIDQWEPAGAPAAGGLREEVLELLPVAAEIACALDYVTAQTLGRKLRAGHEVTLGVMHTLKVLKIVGPAGSDGKHEVLVGAAEAAAVIAATGDLAAAALAGGARATS